MRKPKVSIVIPVYNVENYLRECLDSTAGQTLQNIEIICVNDGSTDSSPAILEEYAAKDSRFVIVHQENAGVSAARNRGMDLVLRPRVARCCSCLPIKSRDRLKILLLKKISQL